MIMETSESELPYEVIIADNAHYMDEDAFVMQGRYATVEEAILVCRNIVELDLDDHLKPGMSSAELYQMWVFFGEDPFIRGANGVPFSARDYVQVRVQQLCPPPESA